MHSKNRKGVFVVFELPQWARNRPVGTRPGTTYSKNGKVVSGPKNRDIG